MTDPRQAFDKLSLNARRWVKRFGHQDQIATHPDSYKELATVHEIVKAGLYTPKAQGIGIDRTTLGDRIYRMIETGEIDEPLPFPDAQREAMEGQPA